MLAMYGPFLSKTSKPPNKSVGVYSTRGLAVHAAPSQHFILNRLFFLDKDLNLAKLQENWVNNMKI
jgi:hypothetical protein